MTTWISSPPTRPSCGAFQIILSCLPSTLSGAFGFHHVTDCPPGFLTSPSAPAIGRSITYKGFYLAKGTYNLRLICSTDASYGIWKVYAGTTEIASFDLYSAGFQNYINKDQTNISISTSGLYDIKIECTGKNGASSSYGGRLSTLIFERTA